MVVWRRENPHEVSLLSALQSLGEAIDAAWAEQHYDAAAFPELAAQALSEGMLHLGFSLEATLASVLTARQMPAQEPPVSRGLLTLTLARWPRFLFELRVLGEPDPSLQSHRVPGAFQLLSGQALASSWVFDPEDEINEGFAWGRLELERVEWLKPGDARPAAPGRQMVHTSVTLDDPTVMLVLRATRPSVLGERRTWTPGASLDLSQIPALVSLQQQALEVMQHVSVERFDDALGQLLTRLDVASAFYLLMQSARHLSEPSRRERVLVGLNAQSPVWGRRFAEALDEEVRRQWLLRRQSAWTAPEHRRLWALMLTLPNRKALLDAIHQLHPGEDALELALEWVRSLALAPAQHAGDPNALGVELNDTTSLILRAMMESDDMPSVLRRLGEVYEPEDVRAQASRIASVCALFRRAPALQPLLR